MDDARSWLDAQCRALPGTETDVKWGDDLCYCLAGKMYVVTGNTGPVTGFTLKVPKDAFGALVARPGFVPAPYLARYHWVKVTDLADHDADELADLVRGSWALVRSKLPARVRKGIPLP